jgi:isoquinoline 1-oxidoreductase beta subunit
MDELAVAAKQDPVAYRRAVVANERARTVLDLAAEKSGWGNKLPPRSGRGVSLTYTFDSYLATVAEVTVSEAGLVRLQRVICALDCGMIVHPDTIAAQIEGGALFGMSAALFNEITLKNGRVEQSNFNDYRSLRIDEAPEMQVHIVPSTERPGGIGETGTVGAAPALANAVYAATGTRVRTLPIRLNRERRA